MSELRKDPLFSFIVPVYKVPKSVFKRCLMSLVNQDYENKEAILVFDGVDPELLNVALPFASENNWIKIKEIEHCGACESRNVGFQESSGEIVSFFNSDYIAKPGMVRMWVDSLMDNPEFGFSYGAYEYATGMRNVYWSKEFDEYELTQANYIDCGFPLWRKYVVKWDSDVKSLQDWDFWLRVVQTHKIKGYYLKRDVSFIAEPPRPGGLSMDSHSNWVERVNFVKEKNEIPINDFVVTSVGAPYHAKEISKMIGADYRCLDTILKQNDYKGVYLIGFYLKPSDTMNIHPDILAHFYGKSKVIHFVGADIHWLKTFSHRDLKMVSGVFNEGGATVLSENEQAQKELLDMGIKSEIVPIPPYTRPEVNPLPEKFSVAVYLTDKSDFDKYCKEETLSIVRSLPHIQFNGYGDGSKDQNYPNFKHYGNLNKNEWSEFVYRNSCYLRLVRHDTRPMATDEFLMAGRRVVTNIPNSYVDYIDTSFGKDWDIFQPGLNDFNWPKTKKSIVQKIISIRNNELGEERKNEISNSLKKELDVISYREKIKSLIYAKSFEVKPEVELVEGK
jgi:glycosyltransferase involved in cell wall biosynthesis